MVEEERRVLKSSAAMFLYSVDVVIGAASLLPLDRQEIVLEYLATMIDGMTERQAKLKRTIVEDEAALN